MENTDAGDVLSRRDSFMAAVTEHEGWQIDPYAALTIFTELVGNVMRHGKSPVTLSLECDGESVVLQLAESGMGFQREIRQPGQLAQGGRGLFVVSRIAANLDIGGNPHGTRITATLPRVAA